MSTTAPSPVKRSRWMDWKPRPRILADSAESEPTKPSKPGSVGFEGDTSAKATEIQAEPCLAGREFDERSLSWPEWKATTLNKLFLEQGLTGEPGRIITDTVRHGQRGGPREP